MQYRTLELRAQPVVNILACIEGHFDTLPFDFGTAHPVFRFGVGRGHTVSALDCPQVINDRTPDGKVERGRTIEHDTRDWGREARSVTVSLTACAQPAEGEKPIGAARCRGAICLPSARVTKG
eukprot:5131578-Heterocapsa_arctica.AAC.1